MCVPLSLFAASLSHLSPISVGIIISLSHAPCCFPMPPSPFHTHTHCRAHTALPNPLTDVGCTPRGTVIDAFKEAGGRGHVVRVAVHEGRLALGQVCARLLDLIDLID
jgi:hypothetical protein